MATIVSGLEFKRFYADPAFWPEGTWHDDTVLVVDGRTLPHDEDPAGVADASTVELGGGFVCEIPAGLGVGDDMALKDYFLLWRKQQTTVTLVVDCPRERLDSIMAAVAHAGGEVRAA